MLTGEKIKAAKEAALEILFKELSVNFFIIDKSGNFVDSNERHWKLLELMHPHMKREEMLGQHSSQVFSEDAWKNSKQAMELGQEVICEETIPLPQQEIVYLSVKRPLFDKKLKKIIGLVGVSFDITKQKKIQKQLDIAKHQAEEATKAKTKFLANMSHDIRTPLIGMVGLSEYLYEHIPETEHKQKALQLVGLAQNLLEVSNSLIEGAKSESGNLPILKEIFNFRKILDAITSLLMPAIQAKNLEFNIHYDANLPDYWIGDEKRMHRILLNLISNAVKFTENGFIRVLVEVKPTKDNAQTKLLQIKVQDSGVGIPKNQQKQIFERFTRLTPAYKDKYKGFGIGLNIVEQFINELKGTIDLESEEGKGSTFICTIPVKEPSRNALKPFLKIEEERVALKVSEIPKLNVLIVEDNSITSFAMQYQLEKFQTFNIHSVEDAEGAMKCYNKEGYDFVLTDLGLPDHDGSWVASEIRAIEKNNPPKKPCVIIGLSAHLDSETEKECLKAGMNQVILKPLNHQKLDEILRTFFLSKDVSNHKKDNHELPNTNEVIDLQASAKKYYSNDLEVAERMLKRLMEILPIEKKQMEQAFVKKDWKKLYHLVHNFYGGCLACGVPSLTAALSEFQKILRKDSIKEIPEFYEKVVNEINRLSEKFKAMKKTKNTA